MAEPLRWAGEFADTWKSNTSRASQRTLVKLSGVSKPQNKCCQRGRPSFYATGCCSVAKSYPTLWPHELHAAHQASLFFTISLSLLKLMSIESAMPSNHLILCCPFSYCPQSFPASGSSNELALCIRWPNYWSFSFSISYSHAYSELSCFGTDWFDHPVVQGTLMSFLQLHSLRKSILGHSAFFMV